jgi:hypothetical protein
MTRLSVLARYIHAPLPHQRDHQQISDTPAATHEEQNYQDSEAGREASQTGRQTSCQTEAKEGKEAFPFPLPLTGAAHGAAQLHLRHRSGRRRWHATSLQNQKLPPHRHPWKHPQALIQ